jgi:hypothetical protein
VNVPHPNPVVARPKRGTRRFRRNCWVGVIDGALVVNDRKNRRHEFRLDSTDIAPHSHRVLFGSSRPWEHHFIDGRGESVVAIMNATRWDGPTAVGTAAGLILDTEQVIPPLRVDGVKLEDSTWPELHYIQLSLAAVWVLVILGRLEVIGLFPWILVAVGLLGYALAALFSGVYVVPWRRRETEERVGRTRRKSRPGERNERKRRKRRVRRRG